MENFTWGSALMEKQTEDIEIFRCLTQASRVVESACLAEFTTECESCPIYLPSCLAYAASIEDAFGRV